MAKKQTSVCTRTCIHILCAHTHTHSCRVISSIPSSKKGSQLRKTQGSLAWFFIFSLKIIFSQSWCIGDCAWWDVNMTHIELCSCKESQQQQQEPALVFLMLFVWFSCSPGLLWWLIQIQKFCSLDEWWNLNDTQHCWHFYQLTNT